MSLRRRNSFENLRRICRQYSHAPGVQYDYQCESGKFQNATMTALIRTNLSAHTRIHMSHCHNPSRRQM